MALRCIGEAASVPSRNAQEPATASQALQPPSTELYSAGTTLDSSSMPSAVHVYTPAADIILALIGGLTLGLAVPAGCDEPVQISYEIAPSSEESSGSEADEEWEVLTDPDSWDIVSEGAFEL